MIRVKKWFREVGFFLLLTLIVLVLQLIILSPVFEVALHHDDWIKRMDFRLIGDSPFTKVLAVWKDKGPYFTYQIYYIGALERLFGFNYQAFHTVNFIFKFLASLSIYPLIRIVFKRISLAFIATLIYAASYSSVENLGWIIMGSDYIAIIWMSLFLLVYYLSFINKAVTVRWLILLSLTFFGAILFSPIRIYPLLLLPPFVEIYSLKERFNTWQVSGKRLVLLYFPFFLIFLYKPHLLVSNFYTSSPIIFQKILQGNWHLALTPVSGMGYILLPDTYYAKLFSFISIETLKDYASFLVGGPLVIFGSLTLIFAYIRSKSRIRFLVSVLFLNFIFSISSFFIYTHALTIPDKLRLNSPTATGLYPVLIGFFVLSIAFSFWREWESEKKKDSLRLALWVGPFFSFVFLLLTWIIADFNLGFRNMHRYLTVASIGSSLFVAAFLVSLYDRLKQFRFVLFRLLAVLPFLLLIVIFRVSEKEIHNHFNSLLKDGRGIKDQAEIHAKINDYLAKYDFEHQAQREHFFYFDTSEDKENRVFYYESFLGSNFIYWMNLKNEQLTDGCIGYFYGTPQELKELVIVKDSIRGINHIAYCVDIKLGIANNNRSVFFGPGQFYAIKLKERELIDIKEETINNLKLGNVD